MGLGVKMKGDRDAIGNLMGLPDRQDTLLNVVYLKGFLRDSHFSWHLSGTDDSAWFVWTL